MIYKASCDLFQSNNLAHLGHPHPLTQRRHVSYKLFFAVLRNIIIIFKNVRYMFLFLLRSFQEVVAKCVVFKSCMLQCVQVQKTINHHMSEEDVVYNLPELHVIFVDNEKKCNNFPYQPQHVRYSCSPEKERIFVGKRNARAIPLFATMTNVKSLHTFN